MMKRSQLKLPRLKTKDELLKSSPELAKLLGAVEPEDPMTVAIRVPSPGPPKNNRIMSANAAVSRPGLKSGPVESPSYDRAFGEEGCLSEEAQLAAELEEVKRERQVLIASIAQVRAEAGTAGAEAQEADIRQLMKELELKKAKLNELKEESRRKQNNKENAKDATDDAERMTPGELSEELAYVATLKEEMRQLDEDLIEAEAKNRLYYLLGERTRRDHMAMDQQVRGARDTRADFRDDLATLTSALNEMRASKEAAEKDLARTKKMKEEAYSDWQKKLRERRKEVLELKKRQQKEAEKERRKREKSFEKERTERELAAKIKMEQEAYQMQIQALAPRIEAMEAAWNRLRTISGADTPEDVINYWEGLKSKEESMRELVRLAERREENAKEEITSLLNTRSVMFEAQPQPGEAPNASGDAAEARMEDAERRMEAARQKFTKLRSVCIGAQQGLRALLERLMVALDEISPEQLRASQQREVTKKNRNKAERKTAHQISQRNMRQTPPTKAAISSPDASRHGPATAASDPSAEDVDKLDGVEEEAHEEGNIDDEHFFPELGDLLMSVSDRLNKITVAAEARSVMGEARPAVKEGDGEGEAAEGEEGADGPPAEGVEGDEAVDESGDLVDGLPNSEKALMKGMHRRSWTGPPYMETIAPLPEFSPPAYTMKRRKGKKRDSTPQPDLHRILGYTGDDIEEEAPPSEEEDAGEEWDGVVDRDFIKHRATKVSARAAAAARG